MLKPNRDINKLSENFKLKVELFLKEVGDIIFITEGLRLSSRQKYLYSLGRTAPGKKVTWTKHSRHQSGEAIDIAFKGDELYPKEHSKWKEIGTIANKYGIDWGYDLWSIDKPHLQDNLKHYIMEKYGKIITRNGLKYPKSIYGIPIRLAKTNSKTLMGKAKIKGYLPGCKKDEILIFENSFKKGEKYLFKIIEHEFNHFLVHKYMPKKSKQALIDFSEYTTSDEYYVSKYAKTQPVEDIAETYAYGKIYKGKDLPKGKKWNKKLEYKFKLYSNICDRYIPNK